jgi:predicted NUDIX family NTP pyrophosphohydrolase
VTESAGILLYRRVEGGVEVLIAHPGGPFWAGKDDHAWSIPKGEIGAGEEPLAAALREFEEESGCPAPDGSPRYLGTIRQRAGKIVHGFAVEGDFDPGRLASNSIEVEWPPRSGRRLAIPEIDRVLWVDPAQAADKLNSAQVAFVERLLDGLDGDEQPTTVVDHGE